LRALGPDDIWKAAYVQPSRRPTDGRYGENPNRLQHYYQFQTILKPSPADAQELYLGSLQAIGLDVHAHDIGLLRMIGNRLRLVRGVLAGKFGAMGWKFRNLPISSRLEGLNVTLSR
jgi:hypothetical protein